MQYICTSDGSMVRLLPVGHEGVFTSPYSDTQGYVGMKYRITKVIMSADANHDAEPLPMYEVTLTDGIHTFNRIEAYPEELTNDETYHSHRYSGEYGAS